MISEDYVSFEIAKLLKEMGFDEGITTYRDDFIQHGNIVIPLQECLSKDKIKTPTLQMAMKWLRKVYNIDISVTPDRKTGYSVLIFKDKRLPFDTLDSYSTYEQACESAIKYCLENLIGDEN